MIEKIEEKFNALHQRVEAKEYNEVIEQIDNLDPKELTPTNKSAIHYY